MEADGKAFSFGFRGRALTKTWLLLRFFACIFFLLVLVIGAVHA